MRTAAAALWAGLGSALLLLLLGSGDASRATRTHDARFAERTRPGSARPALAVDAVPRGDGGAAFGLVGRAPFRQGPAAAPLVLREYALPAPPDGHVWSACRDAVGQALPSATAGAIVERLRRVVEPARWGGEAGGSRAWEQGESRFTVRAPGATHDAVSAFLASLTWVPAWSGLEPAAVELADMTRNGTALERGWAKAALLDASEDLRRATEAALARPEAEGGAGDGEPAAGEAVASRVRVEFRLLATDPTFVRDIGVDVRGLPDCGPWPAWKVRSGGTSLDDLQMEGLERAWGRGDRVRTLETGAASFWSGERYAIGLAEGWILTLRPVPSRDGRFVTLDTRLRRRGAERLVYAPGCRVTIPDTGTFLLMPADMPAPGPSPGDARLLLLTPTLVR